MNHIDNICKEFTHEQMEKHTEITETSDSEEGELSLSCGSSPFENGEGRSSSEDEISDDEAPVDGIAQLDIQPYQFEPYASDTNISSSGDEEEENINRLADNSWCRCGHCQVMPSARECICCMEITRVDDVRNEYPDLQCITGHPGFQTVCLDVHVLQVAYYQYRQQYGERPEEDNARNRYTAYRQFVRWCWQFLGKEVRVIIPACAVHLIRTTFPDQSYTGFHQADSDSIC